ncbi:MAG: hypothetical protein J1E37_04165 [Prevotella sp.]|nr:hypothetical protein [Prevotella sp.]
MATHISKDFTLEELTATSQTDGSGHPLRNVPDQQAACNLCALVHHVLQPLRDAMGHPVKIASGYRSPALNKAVGGVASSQHLTG